MQGDDLPVRSNRVTLDPSVTDSSGLPAAHIDYKLSPNDIALANFGTARLREAAEAAGAIETHVTGPMEIPPAWHLMGTCRMGNTPEDSRDKWLQSDLGRAKSVYRGRQLAAIGRRCESDQHDRSDFGEVRRIHQEKSQGHFTPDKDAGKKRVPWHTSASAKPLKWRLPD